MLKNISSKSRKKNTFLPNAIVIGAMKCGTSSLHNYLSCHPQIFMSQIKELDFFIENHNWKRGLEWYKGNFPEAVKIRGESSPNYSKYELFKGVPEKMHRLIPDAKLIYIVRDPIKRILSHYIHILAEGREKKSIEEVLTDSDKKQRYISCSKYYMQLKHYLDYYPPSSILVIQTEYLAKDRLNTLQKVFKFLNVDPNFKHEDFFKVDHQSKHKQQVTDLNLRLSIVPGGRLIKSAMFHLLGHRVAKELLWHPIEKATITISNSTHQSLIDSLQEDVQKLRDFTGYSFSDWSL